MNFEQIHVINLKHVVIQIDHDPLYLDTGVGDQKALIRTPTPGWCVRFTRAR